MERVNTQTSERPPVKLAFIGQLTGNVLDEGLGGRNAADLAVRLRNAEPGRRFEFKLLSFDDGCAPEIAVGAAESAARDPAIVAAVAHYCSDAALACVDIYHRHELPVVIWGAGNAEIIYGNDYKELHRIMYTWPVLNDVAARFATRAGRRRAVVIHEASDYGRGHLQWFTRSMRKIGGEVVGDISVSANQTDLSAELAQITSMMPDLVHVATPPAGWALANPRTGSELPGSGAPIEVRLCARLRELPSRPLIQGTSGLIQPAVLAALGSMAEGIVGFQGGAPLRLLPGAAFFAEHYAEQGYADPPAAYSPFAYASTALILDTIERAGPERRAIRAALNAIRGYESIIGPISFDEHGQNIAATVTTFVVQDGQAVVWSESQYAAEIRTLGE